VYVAIAAASFAAVETGVLAGWEGLVFGALAALLILGWAASLYLATRTARSGLTLFAVPVFALALMAIARTMTGRAESTLELFIAVAGTIAYAAALWVAAAALVRVEAAASRRHSTFWTFVLLVYLPLGVWVLWPRVVKLRTT
jgi:hypothetical protein